MDLTPLLVEAFERQGYVTSRQLQFATGSSRQAIWKELQGWVLSGVVAIEGAGRGVRYVARDRSRMLGPATQRTDFWERLQERFPRIAYVSIRNGPGVTLRRHAHQLMFPPVVVDGDFYFLDFEGVDSIGPAFARACAVELPQRLAAVHAINANPRISEALTAAVQREELRPQSEYGT